MKQVNRWSRDRRRARLAQRRQQIQKHHIFEALEMRWLMAGDVDLSPFFASRQPAIDPASIPPLVGPAEAAAEGESAASALSDAEGEPAPDLVAFAKALKAAGVVFYGADWCPHCTEQKRLFEDGKNYLPFEEVTNPDRTLNALGLAKSIDTFPTWDFPGDVRRTGVLTLQEISTLSGVAIPTSETPSFVPVSNQTVAIGSPLHIPIDAYDPNGGPLTITVSSNNPAVVEASVAAKHRSLKIDVNNYGEMIVQLFEDKAPLPTARIIELAQSGFFNFAVNPQTSAVTNKITFHRVIDGFVIQTGDPTNTGSGGSTLGDFDDQYHPDLQHNRTGVVSYAKAFDDGNDSQFFFTEGPQRDLDFNHSVFGQLVEGDAVREGISRVPPMPGDDDKPSREIRINSVSVFEDQENGLVLLRATGLAGQQAEVTVTVTDAQGHSVSQVFQVTVAADTFNSGPFLDPIAPVTTPVNTPVTFQLNSTDIENNPPFYDATVSGSTTFNFNVDNATGAITVTPPLNFVGQLELLVGVRGAQTTDSVDQFDRQRVTIHVAPNAPTGLDLLATSDTGSDSTDNLTNLKQFTVRADGLTVGAQVRVMAGNVVVGQKNVTNASEEITVDLTSLQDGQHALTVTQILNNESSAASTALQVTVDSLAPVFTSAPPTMLSVGQSLTYNAQTPDEVAGNVTYALINGPSGAQLDQTTGVLTWIPSSSQRGLHSFSIQARDKAGNIATQNINLNVEGEQLVEYRLATTRLDGTAATNFAIGEEFLLKVFTRDVRPTPAGVVSAYLDVLLPDQLIDVVGDLEFGERFAVDRVGSISATQLDEVGAIADVNSTGGTEFLLFQIRVKAVSAGQGTFQSNMADESPLHDTTVLNRTTAVSEALINFGSAEFTIDAPFAAIDDEFNVDEGTEATLDVKANDMFPGGQVSQLRISAVSAGDKNGQISITEDGRIRYQPDGDFNGVEIFTYTITDDVNGTATGTVTVQVHPVNDPPTAVNDSFTGTKAVSEDSSNNFLDLLQNDSPAPDVGETLRITSVGARSNGGSVTIATNGTHVLYTPAANFSGLETFTYTISDGNGGTATATVTVEVSGINDPPVAAADAFTVEEDSVQVTFDVLANDTTSDPGETLTITAVAPVNNAQGTLTIAGGNNAVLYTPKPNFVGVEVFRYTISDGNGGTAEARVTFTVTGKNDPPTAVDDTGPAGRFNVTMDTGPHTLDVLRNDSSEPDTGETLTITGVSAGSAGGTVTIAADGKSLRYTPSPGFKGTETLQYTISDGNGGTATATVEIEVREFLPSTLSGVVFIDDNNNGVFDSSEKPLGGVQIRLVGTDKFGASVQKSTRTKGDGSYAFIDLAPGNYEVIQTQPEFFVDGKAQIGSQGGTAAKNRLVIDMPEDLQGINNNFAERSLAAKYIDIRDLFASTPRNQLLLVVDTNGGAQTTYAAGNGWQNVETASARLTQSGQMLEITVQNGQQAPQAATVPARDGQKLHVLGETSGKKLLRVLGGRAGWNFQTVSSSASSNDGGEGESTSSAALLLSTPTAGSEVHDGGEGENAAIDAVLNEPSAEQWHGAIDPTVIESLATAEKRLARSAIEHYFASAEWN